MEGGGNRRRDRRRPLGDVITSFISGEWESLLQTAGAWDPSVGIGVAVRFGSHSPFSGAPQPAEPGGTTELDDLLAAAVATTDQAERKAIYDEIAKYISDEAYAPFGMAFSPSQIVRTTVHGPGLTTPIPALAVNSGCCTTRSGSSSSPGRTAETTSIRTEEKQSLLGRMVASPLIRLIGRRLLVAVPILLASASWCSAC